MEGTRSEKTSISLGSRKEILEEIRQKEDRSRSAVIRRAIDYYYLMNYVQEVEPEAGEIEAMELASTEIAEGMFTSLEALKAKHGLEGKVQRKSRKTIR